MKALFLLVSVCGMYHCFCQNSDPYASSTRIKNSWNDCQNKVREAQNKLSNLTEEYKRDAEEFRNGLFCSDCKRSKSQIEKAMKIAFSQHISDGGPNRRVISATPAQMNELYQKYLSDFNRQKAAVEREKERCNDLNNQYNEAKANDYQNQLKSQQEANKKRQDEQNAMLQKQQEANKKSQEEQNARLQAQLQKQQDEYSKFLEQQELQKQKVEQEGEIMKSSFSNNQQEADSKKEGYKQQSELNDSYQDRSSDAKLLLDPKNMANTSEIFGSVLNTTQDETVRKESNLLSNMFDSYQQFQKTLKANIQEKFFGARTNENYYYSENNLLEEERPESGWSFDRNTVRVKVVQPLKDMFNRAYEIHKAAQSYEDEYTRSFQVFEDQLPKTNRETRGFISGMADEKMKSFSKNFDIAVYENNPDKLNEASDNISDDLEYSGQRYVAQAIGNVKGKLQNSVIGKVYNRTVGSVLLRLYKYKQVIISQHSNDTNEN